MKTLRWAVLIGSMLTLPVVVTLILRIFRRRTPDLHYDTSELLSEDVV